MDRISEGRSCTHALRGGTRWKRRPIPCPATTRRRPSRRCTSPASLVQSVACVRSGADSFDESSSALQILRGVDFDGVRGCFDRANLESVLEGAKLLQAFGTLERGRRQTRQSQQELAPV